MARNSILLVYRNLAVLLTFLPRNDVRIRVFYPERPPEEGPYVTGVDTRRRQIHYYSELHISPGAIGQVVRQQQPRLFDIISLIQHLLSW